MTAAETPEQRLARLEAQEAKAAERKRRWQRNNKAKVNAYQRRRHAAMDRLRALYPDEYAELLEAAKADEPGYASQIHYRAAAAALRDAHPTEWRDLLAAEA